MMVQRILSFYKHFLLLLLLIVYFLFHSVVKSRDDKKAKYELLIVLVLGRKDVLYEQNCKIYRYIIALVFYIIISN